MSTNIAPEKLISDADSGLRVWKANRDFKLKNVTVDQYQKTRDQLETTVAEVKGLSEELTSKENQKTQLADDLNEMNIRLRSAAKGYFGPDSSEYELLGGTRASDRKRPARKANGASKEEADAE
jgi:hypothetical protein